MADPTLRRLLEHMGWANQRMFATLRGLPDEVLTLSAWNPEWQIGVIANHIVVASGRLISRITGETAPSEGAAPTTSQELAALANVAAERDCHLLALADVQDGPRAFVRYGEQVEFLASTILAQAIHHATEHRAQIADILAVNKQDVMNLDAMDLWSYEMGQRDFQTRNITANTRMSPIPCNPGESSASPKTSAPNPSRSIAKSAR